MNWRTSSFSFSNGNCVEAATWRKSSRSMSNGQCAEVGGDAGGVLVRDTKDRAGTVLAFTAGAWRAFLAALR